MSRLLCLLLLLLHASKAKSWAEDLEGNEEEEFIKDCRTNSACGGTDVSYPFRLNSTPAYCGVQGFEASCSAAGDAIISLPDLGPCKLISMNFESLRIKLGDERADQCSLQKLIYANLTGSIYGSYTLVRCPSGIATDSDSIRGPIPCLSNESQGQFVYQVDASASMDLLPSQCEGTGSAVGACVSGIVAVLAALIIVYILKKSEKDKQTRFKVEQFLAAYGDAKPTRYSFSNIRKITKRFKNKLGQGGYGSVYKGELSKEFRLLLRCLRFEGEGQEFINEVATIGRIHHINIVRLLGFCSERSTRALIYEFMPNESLEKYIFLGQDKGSNKPFNMEKLLNIAIGIARGIKYLHQGCEQRILHFDIKPHNILLDHQLNPKISDFGLAKLCSREISIVTMTAARGTMGYIAPEMYCRNFGTVSYKSDVYSFDMLLLEMIGGRKNHDPEIGKKSEIYYPEWVYDRLVERQDLVLTTEVEEKDGEIMKKLSKVTLWCIQWNPTERPTMTRILHMLTSSEEVHMPPKPFVSNINHDYTN
ncbi:rust resistance kinase Lr10-like [Zingiber officinale]|uniref:Protein kinase domain-containing protein n=1 Tax=Zingiber officinale TaxID=94328 RepID=A0A8J5GGB1_ZINOF|nr:rust resistance kinase Lr10-like [Zingiber officinale]KAG6499862.1 hypothetical protein ZIOFF_039661 [Zingiber officinale]